MNKKKKFYTFLACALAMALIFSVTTGFAESLYKTISVYFNAQKIVIDGKSEDIENITYNGRTYVPIRDIADVFGQAVVYDAQTSTVELMDKSLANIMSSEIAFLVNARPVRTNYFTQMINYYKLNSGITTLNRDEYNELKEFVKDEIKAIYVCDQYAEKLGVSLTSADIAQMNEKVTVYMNNFGGEEAFRKLLEDNGITFDVYMQVQKHHALRSKLTDRFTETISESTVRRYYDENIESFSRDMVKAKHIFLTTVDDLGYPYADSKKVEIKDKMQHILVTILTGEVSFDEAMHQYSQDPGLKTNPDGYTFTTGEMVKAFENTAFALSAGEISGIVESEDGYHIINVVDKFTLYEPFENVKENIFNSLRNERYYKVMDPIIEDAEIILNTPVYNNI